MSVLAHGVACAEERDEGDRRAGKARKTWDTRKDSSSPCDACKAVYPNKSKYWAKPTKGIWLCWDCAAHVWSVEWLEEESPGESSALASSVLRCMQRHQ